MEQWIRIGKLFTENASQRWIRIGKIIYREFQKNEQKTLDLRMHVMHLSHSKKINPIFIMMCREARHTK